MATLQEIRDAVDAMVATIWAGVQNKEDAYAAAHDGRFWQGLKTHLVTPADGATALPTIGLLCPTDQLGDPWPLAIRNTSMNAALRIDSYNGPLGFGYQGIVWVTVLGNTWTRTAQVGPETWRQAGWAQLVASGV